MTRWLILVSSLSLSLGLLLGAFVTVAVTPADANVLPTYVHRSDSTDEQRLVKTTPTPYPQSCISVSAYWTPSILQWSDIITRYSCQYSIDPNLVASVMSIESGGRQNALSPAGAIGLLQVMPFHPCASWNPELNVSCGVYIMAKYYHSAGDDWRMGLAAYNAGERGRDLYGMGYTYADRVLRMYNESKMYDRNLQ